MEIAIEETLEDEYWLEGKDGYVFGAYPTIDQAAKAMKLYPKDYIKAHDMVIRHHLELVIDKSVHCSEII